MGAFTQIFKGLVTGDPIKSIGDLIDQFHLSPEQKAQIQQAAQALELEREQIEAARDQALGALIEQNTADARGMQKTVKSALPPLLALTVTVGFFGLLYLLIYRSIPPTSHDVIIAMVGVLGAAWGAVVNFYFGSSSGSADKNETIAAALKSSTATNAQ